MSGKLYVVGTPIGNLEDMSVRAVKTLQEVDFIAAEDTRVTLKLLSHFEIKKPMVSYYEHALQKGEGILRRIEAGESCALCSDAGMPCVSDPGEVIVRDALARGIKVVPVPAASACVTALAVSGQDTSRWVFEGFLPVNRKQKKERLAELLQEKRTTIFYEAPHKLRTTLDDLANAFGADRSITLCRELTKLHEDIWKTTLGEAVEHYKTNEPRGEYVLVMAGAPETADPEQELTDRWVVEQMSQLTAMTASFVLATPTETDGALFPGRIMLANTCMWTYRSDECGYTGGAVADEFDKPTTDIRKDRCSKCMRGCELRRNVGNFGGFLSINKLSQ